MSGIWQLAWRYVWFNKTKTLILIACIFLTVLLPIAFRILLSRFEQQILKRADRTPAIIGSKGSQLDLVLHALYFDRDAPDRFAFSETQRVLDSALATPVPVFVEHTAADFPIVGTTLGYFQQRGLQVETGIGLTSLGDCVLGSEVANLLGLTEGDSLLSDRENVLDLAGKYPLKMKVAGVLQPTDSPDDRAVFVDLKTAWVIEGLGHGHQDLATESDDEKVVRGDDGQLIATAAVLPYTEITEQNIESFHFHGNKEDFPISAILAFADSQKNETILQGRFESDAGGLQLVRPPEVVRELMALLFQFKKFFDANAMLISLSTLLLLMLVLMLSARLRKPEMETMFKLGCSRGTIAGLQLAEMLIVLLAAIGLVALASWLIASIADDLLNVWLRG